MGGEGLWVWTTWSGRRLYIDSDATMWTWWVHVGCSEVAGVDGVKPRVSCSEAVGVDGA